MVRFAVVLVLGASMAAVVGAGFGFSVRVMRVTPEWLGGVVAALAVVFVVSGVGAGRDWVWDPAQGRERDVLDVWQVLAVGTVGSFCVRAGAFAILVALRDQVGERIVTFGVFTYAGSAAAGQNIKQFVVRVIVLRLVDRRGICGPSVAVFAAFFDVERLVRFISDWHKAAWWRREVPRLPLGEHLSPTVAVFEVAAGWVERPFRWWFATNRDGTFWKFEVCDDGPRAGVDLP